MTDASHELRTPLASLRTNLEVLDRVDELPEPERDRLVTDLRAELEGLISTVDDLLELAGEQEQDLSYEELWADRLVEETDFDEAWDAAQQMHQIAQSCHDRVLVCVALRNLGTIAVLQGDTAIGEDLLRRCRELADTTPGTDHVTAWATAVLGSAAFARDDLEAATGHYREAVRQLRDLGDLNFLALILRRQAQIDLRSGHPEGAAPLLEESLRHNLVLRSPTGMAACLVALADIARTRGEVDLAAEGLGRAEALLEASGALLAHPDQEHYDECRASIEDHLGRACTRELLASGSRKPWEELWLP